MTHPRQRIEEILEGCEPENGPVLADRIEQMLTYIRMDQERVVKELREAVDKPRHPAVLKCGCESGRHTCHNCVREMGRKDALVAFDLCAKKLLEG